MRVSGGTVVVASTGNFIPKAIISNQTVEPAGSYKEGGKRVWACGRPLTDTWAREPIAGALSAILFSDDGTAFTVLMRHLQDVINFLFPSPMSSEAGEEVDEAFRGEIFRNRESLVAAPVVSASKIGEREAAVLIGGADVGVGELGEFGVRTRNRAHAVSFKLDAGWAVFIDFDQPTAEPSNFRALRSPLALDPSPLGARLPEAHTLALTSADLTGIFAGWYGLKGGRLAEVAPSYEVLHPTASSSWEVGLVAEELRVRREAERPWEDARALRVWERDGRVFIPGSAVRVKHEGTAVIGTLGVLRPDTTAAHRDSKVPLSTRLELVKGGGAFALTSPTAEGGSAALVPILPPSVKALSAHYSDAGLQRILYVRRSGREGFLRFGAVEVDVRKLLAEMRLSGDERAVEFEVPASTAGLLLPNEKSRSLLTRYTNLFYSRMLFPGAPALVGGRLAVFTSLDGYEFPGPQRISCEPWNVTGAELAAFSYELADPVGEIGLRDLWREEGWD